MNGVTVQETHWKLDATANRFYSDEEILDLFPDDGSSICNALLRRAQAADAEVDRLRGIVDKLPKTADGVTVVPRMDVFYPSRQELIRIIDPLHWNAVYIPSGGCQLNRQQVGPTECYSTREAAEAAERGGG